MLQPVNPWRVLAKGVILFLAAEFTFYVIHPDLSWLNVYNSPAMKRQRFPFNTHMPDDTALDAGDLGAMFASHVVSEPKAPNEYRVFILGDSTVWGASLPVNQTLSAQLNQLKLTCENKNVRFYNLSYPSPSATKDLMILDEAMRYQPDSIIWPLTLYTMMPSVRTNHWVIELNPDELYQLNARFHFLPKKYPSETVWNEFKSRQIALYRILRYQLFAAVTTAIGVDQMMSPERPAVAVPMTRDLNFEGIAPPTLGAKQLSLDEIGFGYQIANRVPLLLINEPMQIEQNIPNSDVQYNDYYPRWVYDQYRQQLSNAAAKNKWDYLDLWNVFPPSDFSTPLHLNPKGENQLAKVIAPYIIRGCP
ncbi:MAG: SGNH/GDSL hydrolase family protein [Anaerolineales bacterium]